MNNKKIWISLLIALAAISLILFFIKQHHHQCLVCINLKAFSPEVIKHFISGFGVWGIAIYIVLYTINTMILIPPIAFMSLSAGVLFGPIGGTLALTVGSFCGTTATFIIARFFGGKLVDKFVKGKAAEFNVKLSKNGFIVLLPMRLIGFPPYEFVNYASGLSKISL